MHASHKDISGHPTTLQKPALFDSYINQERWHCNCITYFFLQIRNLSVIKLCVSLKVQEQVYDGEETQT